MIYGSLSGVSASSYATSRSEKNPMETDMEYLKQAIESGDLDAAKKAYSTIKERMQKHQGTQAKDQKGPTSGSSFEDDFAALGEALESGDLKSASSALTTITDNMKAHKPPQRPPQMETDEDTTDWISLLSTGSTINISA